MSVYAHLSLDSEKCTRPFPEISPTQRGCVCMCVYVRVCIFSCVCAITRSFVCVLVTRCMIVCGVLSISDSLLRIAYKYTCIQLEKM